MSHSARSTFFSRIHTTQQPSDSPSSYLSITRPHANTPSFFGKSHRQQLTGRHNELHAASATHQGGDGSTSLMSADTEDGSIHASLKRLRPKPSFPATREGGNYKQYPSSEDLTGDTKASPGRESISFAVPSTSNSDPALTPLGQPPGLSCTAPDTGSSSRTTPKVGEDEDDDVPFSIRKSFKELKSVKDELERQRGENERLRAELSATQKETADTLARLNKMKQMTKRSIESSSKTLVELRKELTLLKSQSDESFAFAAKARSALLDIDDLRVAIKDSSENCQRIKEDLDKAAEMKGLIRDLESERANARKANDLLRDKLTDIASQYSDAMERLQSAECTNANQTNALRVALDDLHNASLLAAARTAKLDDTQKELSDALTACALAKENVAQWEKRSEKLVRDADEKALVTAALQRENAELQALLNDRESSISSMLSLKEEILSMLSSSNNQRSVLDSLRKTSAEQLQTIGELNGRCHTLERENEERKQELANQIAKNAALRADCEATNGRENVLKTIIEGLNAEKAAVETKSRALQDELRRLAEERKQEDERTTQLQIRCHALQERFEDQSATLKLARESHGDMQERLITAEATSAAKLEAETGKLRQEVLSVLERSGLLQRSVDEYKRQLEEQQGLMTTMRNEYEKRLKDERDGGHSRMQALQERMVHADSEKAKALKEADGIRDSLTTAQSELTTLKEQVQNIQVAVSERDNQINDLTARNFALQAEKLTLIERGDTIGARYDANDLSNEEKTLVNRILEESRYFS
ncbi:hypothetical protein F5148DRAFT_54941 [Russula earlei]|uniref:Uncharacterized protein n=1 Tax=Russula earlei TaxID=71964 RepID=A0ACC0UM80_9AGAM|nr:hypothetical protein F5148DRAFT_54941 [Russula earlei]